MARAGYGARGIVYLIVGGLALLAALDVRNRVVGTRGALRSLADEPSGPILIGTMAAGFLGFAVWRLVQATLDPGGLGRNLRGVVVRAALGVSAMVYLTLAVFAGALLLGLKLGGEEGALIRRWIASLLSTPWGSELAFGTGSVIATAGAAMVVRGLRAKFGRRLACGRRMRAWALPVSRFGLVARGVVFALTGLSVIVAAFEAEADEARNLAGVLRALEGVPYGWTFLIAAAVGLAAFGLYGVIEAVYRRIDTPDLD
jgi:hypothetical protein